jgi:Methyltransferase domain
VRCKICSGETSVTHSALVLKNYQVEYHLCGICDYWATDEPFWLEQAYSEAVSSMDTGTVARNISIHRRLAPTLVSLFGAGPYVDWAGGAGMLVRLMRDSGLDFYWQDAYAENVLAKGLDWERRRDGRNAVAVTAMEVMEHTPDPLTFLRELMDGTGTDTVIFSQELHHGADPGWWYLAPECGQHVSFYSSRTLADLGQRLGLNLHTSRNLHMLTRQALKPGAFRAATRRAELAARLGSVGTMLTKRLPSLTEADAARAAEELAI